MSQPIWDQAFDRFEGLYNNPDFPRVTPEVVELLKEVGRAQNAKGLEKYGAALTTKTKIDTPRYALEEACDGFVYALKHLAETPKDDVPEKIKRRRLVIRALESCVEWAREVLRLRRTDA